MMLRTALLALLAAAVSAKSFTPSGDVALNSALGRKMMEKAQVVEHARNLGNNNNNNFYDMYKYSLKYIGCSSLIQVAAEANAEEGNILYTQHLVRFALCPSSACASSCTGGGEYVMAMADFVDAYTEAKLTEQEYTCENIRENCYCDNANDDQVCENDCYTNEGHDECIEYDGEENFEIQRYLECQEMEGQNNNNNNNNGAAYYVGPYCSPKDGKSIHMGVFSDMGCTTKADDALYASANYGVELPFISASIVSHDCIDCKEVDENENNNNNNNNNNNQEEEPEVKEVCQNTYEVAAKCEENMEKQYNKDTTGCDYINNILPKLSSTSRNIANGSSVSVGGGSSSPAAKAFAGIFAFTTVLFAAYAYFLYRKIKRGSVNLSSQ